MCVAEKMSISILNKLKISNWGLNKTHGRKLIVKLKKFKVERRILAIGYVRGDSSH